MSESADEMGRCGDGLIILKCRGCKRPTLFKLQNYHEADDHDYRAKSYCKRCVQDDPLNDVVVRKLEPALVDNQQIGFGCHVPDNRYSDAWEGSR